uniref:Uncharacterized protein n=1 Tax=Triticum urartu TaxID=4572 RepID=A0A8R7K3E6_TRIUA
MHAAQSHRTSAAAASAAAAPEALQATRGSPAALRPCDPDAALPASAPAPAPARAPAPAPAMIGRALPPERPLPEPPPPRPPPPPPPWPPPPPPPWPPPPPPPRQCAPWRCAATQSSSRPSAHSILASPLMAAMVGCASKSNLSACRPWIACRCGDCAAGYMSGEGRKESGTS